MNIVVDARTMGSHPSGIGFYLFDFIKELIKNSSFRITLLTDIAESEQILYIKDKGIPVICFGKRVFRSVGVYSYFGFIKKYLKSNQPDLFWEPNNLLPMKMKGYHGKIVLTIHDLFPITNPEYFSFIYRNYFSIGTRKSVKMADALLYVSNETRRMVAEKIPEAKTKAGFVSYLIVSPLIPKSSTDNGYFLYIGNLERRKGTDLLLKAYVAYHNTGGKKPLYLGGSIRENEIKKLLLEVQLKCDDVHYLGYLTADEKCNWLAGCSAFIFPSKAEGFGIPPLEALYYEKPLIISDLPIFKEVLQTSASVFDIAGNESQQIKELSILMKNYIYQPVDKASYRNTLSKYSPENLSNKLEAFLFCLED